MNNYENIPSLRKYVRIKKGKNIKELEEVALHCTIGDDSFKALVLRKMSLLCNDARKKIDSIIEILETEDNDAGGKKKT